MKRPTIKSPCVADRYRRGDDERVAEFMAPNGLGGLIRVEQRGDNAVTVEVYRCDDGVHVIAPADPVRDAAPDMLAALKALTKAIAFTEAGHAIVEVRDIGQCHAAAVAAIARAEGRANG